MFCNDSNTMPYRFWKRGRLWVPARQASAFRKMNAVLDVFVAIGSVSIEGADALIPLSALPDLGHSNTADV